MSLRNRKIKYLKEQQRIKKGLPIRKLQVRSGVTKVKRVTNRNLMVKPNRVEQILDGQKVALRKDKINRLKNKMKEMKKPSPKRLNKRMLFY